MTPTDQQPGHRRLATWLSALALAAAVAGVPAAAPAAASPTAAAMSAAKTDFAAAVAAANRAAIDCNIVSPPGSGWSHDPCAHRTISTAAVRAEIGVMVNFVNWQPHEARGTGELYKLTSLITRMQIDELVLGRYDAPGGAVRSCVDCPLNSGAATAIATSTGIFDVRYCGENGPGGYRLHTRLSFSLRWADNSLTSYDWYSYPTRWWVAAQTGSCS